MHSGESSTAGVYVCASNVLWETRTKTGSSIIQIDVGIIHILNCC